MAGIQDATIRHPGSGRGSLFVHIKTASGQDGLAPGLALSRDIIHRVLKPALVGQDPLCIEKLWEDMFWRVRGFGRKGVAFCAISAVDIALWDLKAKLFGVPLYRLLGPFTDRVPIYGSGGMDLVLRRRAGARADGLCRARHPARQDESGQRFWACGS